MRLQKSTHIQPYLRAIHCNNYDGSFIRHKLNGKTGWTTGRGKGSVSTNGGNEKIGAMVSDFYGSGAFASFVTTPAKVSWHANEKKMQNDPKWNGSVAGGTAANNSCTWINDNVWLPSLHEIYAKTMKDDISTGQAIPSSSDGLPMVQVVLVHIYTSQLACVPRFI